MFALLDQLSHEVAREAAARRIRIVLAESCTAGLVAHLLSRIPGASEWLCGSAVVYRNATKTAWLGVPARSLSDPQLGPVCSETASAMCAGALRQTPEALLSASVTGHLGPGAPDALDGVIYIGVLIRHPAGGASEADVRCERLALELPQDSPFETLRVHRQHEAAANVLLRLTEALLRVPESD